jgi:hypothetical protein
MIIAKYFLATALGLMLLTQVACQKTDHVNSGEAQPTPKNPNYKFDSKNGCYIPAIVGGQKVDKTNPLKNHVVMVRSTIQVGNQKKDRICTGTLIGNNTVLTAAHCFANKNNILYSAIYATIDLNCSSGFNKRLIYEITSVDLHPNYALDSNPSKNSQDYDLAVVKFSGILPSEYRPLSLLPIDIHSLINNPAQKFIMTGYGKTSTNSDLLPELRFLTKQASSVFLTKPDPSSGASIDLIKQMGLIGLKQNDARGVCNGDSGGPLLLASGNSYVIVGVASYLEGFTNTICENGKIYYSFTTTYYDWITSHLP